MSDEAAARKRKGAAAGQPACVDGLLWVGQSYPQFFCGDSASCVNPARPQGPHCFVHEAERRGVSRRIPQVPPWARPGRTRIFLAHRGGEREPWKGRIFGYFVLDRIEVMATPHSLPHGGHDGRPSTPSLRGRPTSKPPKPSRNGEPEEDEDGPEPGEKARYEEFWNGNVITTHTYDPGKGRWVRTGAGRPRLPESPEDGDGRVDGGLRFLPVDDEGLAEHRGCSLREDPGAVYLVDELEAEIVDAFAYRLDQGSIRGEGDAAAARAVFNAVVDEIAIRRTRRARVPRSLRGRAHVRGELVLFDDPPLFEQRPQAQFRGLAHIDGDRLLAQIVKGVRKPAIHSCRHRSGVTTQQEVVAVIAERAHANKAFAGEVLTELSALAHEELKDYGEFRVPGMGTLKLGKGGEVRFHPYRSLLG